MKKIIIAILIVAGFLASAQTVSAQSGNNIFKLQGLTILPVLSQWTLTLPYLGSGSSPCLTVNSAGLLSTMGCTVGGASSTNPFMATYFVATGTAPTATSTFNGPIDVYGSARFRGNVSADVGLVASGQVKATDGTVGAPAYSFSADLNTGMYRLGTDILSFATAGADRLTIIANGNVGIGNSTPTYILDVGNPAYSADIINTLRVIGRGTGFTSNNEISKLILSSSADVSYANFTTVAYRDGSNQSVGGKFQVTNSGSPLTAMTITSTGNVGIGTTSPYANLSINPVAGYAQNMFYVGSTTGGTKFVIDNSGKVGIGTSTPGQKLSVAGDILGNNIIGTYFTGTSTTATSSISAALTIGTGTFNPNKKLAVIGGVSIKSFTSIEVQMPIGREP